VKHPHLTDDQLRVMRNALYQPDDPASEAWQRDSAWAKVKDHWREDADWLSQQYQKEQTKNQTKPA